MFFRLMILAIGFIATTAHADLPLTVEDLTADKNRFKLDTSVSYFNQSQYNLNEPLFHSIVLGDGRTINIPAPATQSSINTDAFIWGAGLRYGITDNIELGVKTNVVSNYERYNHLSGIDANSSHQWQDVALTMGYSLKDHQYLPETLLFSEINAYDRTQGLKPTPLSSILVGGTIYTINDPIVLSLTGTYQKNKHRNSEQNNWDIDVGDVASINGLVGFAVNPDMTLTGGVGVRYKQADSIANTKTHYNQTQTHLNLGLAYALSDRSNITANIRTNISGNSSSTLSLGLTTKLGELPTPLSQKYRQNKGQ